MINTAQLRQRRKNGEFSHPNQPIFHYWIITAAFIVLLIGICATSHAQGVDFGNIRPISINKGKVAENGGESAFQANIKLYYIAQIESSNNPDAYNKKSGARGLCQITPIVLKEFNLMNGKRYKLNDLFIDQVNLMIADWYINKRIPQMLKYLKIKDSKQNRIIAYNWGIGNMLKWYRSGAKIDALPRETRQYLIKYMKFGGLK